MFKVITHRKTSHHRIALYNAVNKFNANFFGPGTENKKFVFIVGTKQIITHFLNILFSKKIFLLQFCGFGRLYTDFGFSGRTVFDFLLIILSKLSRVFLIVENNDDRLHCYRLTKRMPYKINGSGFEQNLFVKSDNNYEGPLTLGYLSRFGSSKRTNEILDLCRNLPNSVKIIIAGKDIQGTHFNKTSLTDSGDGKHVISTDILGTRSSILLQKIPPLETKFSDFFLSRS